MSKITDDILFKVKEANDIINVISERVNLKKAGRNYKGLCPFHSEKSPSFSVNPDKQFFHCFGCGEGGDVFSFLVKYENISFFEAVKKLAERGGIQLPKNDSPIDKAKADLKDKLFAINNDATDFFSANLKSEFGAHCLEYLRNRGMSDEIIKKFRLGCAIDSWDSVMKHLQSKGHKPELIEKAGLIIKKDGQSNYYDRFRKRVLFPIFSVGGNVIGFGGRVMDDSLPKYLNSPETPVFSKGYNLYGMNFAKEAARRQGYLIIVEGYLDVISPYQDGIENICATLGTALTEHHIRLIKRYVNKVVLIFDPDAAGIKAVLRGLELFIKTDMKVNVVALPEKLDPDTFVKKHGQAAFLKELKRSVKILDFFINYVINENPIESIDDKIAIVNETLPKISMVKNRIERDYFIKKLSEKLGIDEKLLRQELVQETRGSAGGGRKSASDRLFRARVNASTPKAEATLLHIILRDKELAGTLKDSLDLENIASPAVKRVLTKLFELLDQKGELNIDSIISDETDEVRSIVSKSIVQERQFTDAERDQAFQDCVIKIKTDSIDKKVREIQRQIEKAGREKNETLKEELMKEHVNILMVKKELLRVKNYD